MKYRKQNSNGLWSIGAKISINTNTNFNTKHSINFNNNLNTMFVKKKN